MNFKFTTFCKGKTGTANCIKYMTEMWFIGSHMDYLTEVLIQAAIQVHNIRSAGTDLEKEEQIKCKLHVNNP